MFLTLWDRMMSFLMCKRKRQLALLIESTKKNLLMSCEEIFLIDQFSSPLHVTIQFFYDKTEVYIWWAVSIWHTILLYSGAMEVMPHHYLQCVRKALPSIYLDKNLNGTLFWWCSLWIMVRILCCDEAYQQSKSETLTVLASEYLEWSTLFLS